MVEDGDDDNPARPDAIVDGERKTVYRSDPHIAVCDWIAIRLVCDGVQYRFHLSLELATKTRSPIFVPLD